MLRIARKLIRKSKVKEPKLLNKRLRTKLRRQEEEIQALQRQLASARAVGAGSDSDQPPGADAQMKQE